VSGRATAPLGYRPALDGLRAVSVLGVVGFHALALPGGGFLGVDVFFVLSGFLITNLLLQEHAATGTLDLLRFYARRARRLLPALVVAVAGFLAIEAFVNPGSLGSDLIAAAAGVTYVSNVLIAASPSWVVPVQHLWSLAAEEQFYLLWPMILVTAFARRLSRRSLATTLALAVAAIWVYRIVLTLGDAPVRRLYFAPDTSLDPIVLGCLLALLYDGGHLQSAYRHAVVRRVAVPACALVAELLVVLVPNTDARWFYLWGKSLFGVAVAVVLAAIVVDPTSLWARALERLRLPALGGISYGIYLWHPILLYAARVPVLLSIPAAVGAAALSHRLVERRFLRRRGPRRTVPVPAVAVG
jgi:peptidoglycan/LPS O-acetylase OafA/YrhL